LTNFEPKKLKNIWTIEDSISTYNIDKWGDKYFSINSKGNISVTKDIKSEYKFSDFQKSERDFAFIINKNFKSQELVNIIKSGDNKLIKSVRVFDVFEGENIPEGKKSIAVNVTIQSEEKTLNENDLDNINKLIISSVESKSGAKIRS